MTHGQRSVTPGTGRGRLQLLIVHRCLLEKATFTHLSALSVMQTFIARLFFPKALQKEKKKKSAQTAAFMDLSEYKVCLLGFPRPHTIKNQVCGAFSTLNIRHSLPLMATGSTTSWAALLHLPFFFLNCLQNF